MRRARGGAPRAMLRRPMLRWCPSLLALALAPLEAGCGSAESVQPCGEIPAAGCPIGRGGSCQDVACAALYDCVDGDWIAVERCSGDGATVSSSSGGGEGAGDCDPVVIDRSGEAEGCRPDLMEPDCPAVAVDICPDPCATGCVDFFLCTDEGWLDVAACDEDGVIRITR